MTPTILVLLAVIIGLLALGGLWFVTRVSDDNPANVISPLPGRGDVQVLRSVRVLQTPEEITEAQQRTRVYRLPPPPRLHPSATPRVTYALKESR